MLLYFPQTYKLSEQRFEAWLTLKLAPLCVGHTETHLPNVPARSGTNIFWKYPYIEN